jgi:hypothetical protein
MTFSLSLGNSSDTECVFQYGDTYYDVIFALFTGTKLTTIHLYNAPGEYLLMVYCENPFGSRFWTSDIKVEQPVENVHFLGEDTILYTEFNEMLNMLFVADAGTDVEFKVNCNDDDDDDSCGEIKLVDALSGSFEIRSSELTESSYGNATVTLEGFNDVSSDIDTRRVSVDKAIVGLSFSKTTMYFETGTSSPVGVSCTAGSRINFRIDLADGTTELHSFPDETLSTEFTHAWDEPGCYSLTVTASNPISSGSETAVVCIEYPLPTLADLKYLHVDISDVGPVNFIVTLNRGK